MKDQQSDIGRNISIINKNFKIFLKVSLSETDLTPSDFMIILTLFGKDGISQEGIIDQLGYDKAVMARRIKKLEKSGYLIKRKSKEDLRAQNISLTSKGLELKPYIVETLLKWYKAITEDIPDEIIEVLIVNMEKMASNSVQYVANAKKEAV